MTHKAEKTGTKKTKRKEIMEKILIKISAAVKEYATPLSERKIAKEIKKASKGITDIVVKTKTG